MKLYLTLALIAGLVVAGTSLWAGMSRSAGLLVNTDRTVADDTPPGGRRVVKTDAEWKKLLTPDQYEVLRHHGTERAFTSPLNDVHDKGTFFCAACHNPLFTTDTKFNSGTGWPSFYAPIAKNAVKENRDMTFGMVRTEINCSVCGGHLGHVFDDGPKPTGLRYCMNGVAMTFEKK